MHDGRSPALDTSDAVSGLRTSVHPGAHNDRKAQIPLWKRDS
jgi:hypothetical protein